MPFPLSRFSMIFKAAGNPVNFWGSLCAPLIFQTPFIRGRQFSQKLSFLHKIILSRVSEAGFPKNRLGSGSRRDMDQGPFSPSIGGLGLTHILTDHLKFLKYGPTLNLFY